MVDLDRKLVDAVCDRIKQLEEDNKFLNARLIEVTRERNSLRREVSRLMDWMTSASWEVECSPNQELTKVK